MVTPEELEAKRRSIARRLVRECKHLGPGSLRETGRIEACSCDCKLTWRVEWMAFDAGIPAKFWHWDPSTIDTNIDVFEGVIRPWPTVENLRRVFTGSHPGYGLYLYGENGTGKTTFLTWTLMELIRNTQLKVYYTTTLRLISDFKRTFGRTDTHAILRKRLDALLGRHVVVIDELGKETYRDGDSFSRLELETIFRASEESGRPLLLGSNKDLESLGLVPDKGGYGPTIKSIITGHMLPVGLEPGDRRIKLGLDSMEVE